MKKAFLIVAILVLSCSTAFAAGKGEPPSTVTIQTGSISAGDSYTSSAMNLSTVEGWTSGEFQVVGAGTVTVQVLSSNTCIDGQFVEAEGASDVLATKSAGRYVTQIDQDFAKCFKLLFTAASDSVAVTATVKLR